MTRKSIPITDEQLQGLPPEFRAMMEWAIDEITILRKRVKELEAENADLKEKLACSSRNSSKPPSSDGPSQKKASQKQPSGKTRGGQKGRKKANRKLIPQAQCDSVATLIPEQCAHCGEKLAGVDPQPQRHQVWDIPPIEPVVTEYQRHRLTCSCCRKATRADLPTGVPTGQAGPNLIAHVGILLTKYRMSHRLVAEYLETILGIPCSDGWIAKLQRIASRSLAKPYAKISQQVRQSPVIHMDETSYKIKNQSGWLWGAIEKGVSLFRIAGSRGAQIAQQILGETYSGIVVSDRYSSYNWLETERRQLCWAHLKRDFTKLSESKHESTNKIGEQLLELQSHIFNNWHRFKSGQLARSTLKENCLIWQGKMHTLLEQGWLTGNQKAAGMCRHIWKYFDALWTFTQVAGVDPTNNTAERGLRGGVIKRKLSFGVDSESGRQFLERTLSVLATCRQRGVNELAYVTACVQAHFAGQTAPDLLQRA